MQQHWARPLFSGWVFAALASGLAAWSCFPPPALADTFGNQQRALALITDTADHICSVVHERGEASSSKTQGEVRAQLNGLAARLADAGVNVSGNISNGRYEGVLRDQLADTLKNNAECKLKVFESLQARLVPTSMVETPPSSQEQGISQQPQQSARQASASPPPSSPFSERDCAEEGSIRACAIVIAADSGEKNTLTILLRIRNIGREAMGVALIGPLPSVVASDGSLLELASPGVRGIGYCSMLRSDYSGPCLNPRGVWLPLANYTRVAPGSLANASFRFEGGPDAKAIILGFQAAFAVRKLGAEQSRNEQASDAFTVGLSDLAVAKPH